MPCGNTPYDEGPFTIATDGGKEVPREPVARWHELKTDPDVFDAVVDGSKTFEIRLNDRDFRVGDGLLLRRTRDTGWAMKNTGAPLEYTGEELRRVVSHVLHGPVYGLAAGWVILSPAASPSTTRQQEVATWLLYEHEDGHHAVAPTAEAATFAHGDPAWHRVGPVEVSSASRPYRSAAGDTLASIALVELRDANRWPEILSLNTHVLDGAAGPGSKPRAGTLLTLPSPSTTRQQEVGSGWKLVPVEPTQAMLRAGLLVHEFGWCEASEDITECGVLTEAGITQADADAINAESMTQQAEIYRAMLAAAPSTPENADGGPHG